MITEDYVSFEIAKLLKEKGFDGICRAAYTSHGSFKDTEIKTCLTNKSCSGTYWECAAPTLQMAMKWLRENYGIYIEIPIVGIEFHNPTKWYFGWRCQTKEVIDRCRKEADFTSYEDACEDAIKYCLTNLI